MSITLHCAALKGIDENTNKTSLCDGEGATAEVGSYSHVTCPKCLDLLAIINGEK
jgi:hypothetical protein